MHAFEATEGTNEAVVEVARVGGWPGVASGGAVTVTFGSSRGDGKNVDVGLVALVGRVRCAHSFPQRST